MTVIKSAKSNRLLKDAIVLDMGDLARQAERILQSARADAAQIIGDARLEAARLIEGADGRGHAQGFERGRAEGHAQGVQEGRQQALSQLAERIHQLQSQWHAALEQWETQRAAMLHDAREDVIRFAFAIAQRIVHRQVKADPTIVADQLVSALALLSRPTSVEVKVHPDDHALVEQTMPALLAKFATCEHAAIATDPSIHPGGCVVTTRGGRVDATIQTQLDRIAQALVPLSQSPNAQEAADAEPVP